MNLMKILFGILSLIFGISVYGQKEINQRVENTGSMMIRISEIEIHPEFLAEYLVILQEESKASVSMEKGVISIFPMYKKEKPNEIRILEIYKDQEAYQAHLQSPHFKHYKTNTLKMVKSLALIDMDALDVETMESIFEKLNTNK